VAAQLAAIGLEAAALRVIRGDADDVERLAWVRIAERVQEQRGNDREDQAVRIINALKKAL
jgi:hypothetical protein